MNSGTVSQNMSLVRYEILMCILGEIGFMIDPDLRTAGGKQVVPRHALSGRGGVGVLPRGAELKGGWPTGCPSWGADWCRDISVRPEEEARLVPSSV